MNPRPAAGFLVSALIRQVEAAGGSAMVLARGDATAGAILLVIADRGVTGALLERGMRFDGAGFELRPTGPKQLDDPGALAEYVARRRGSDPDLWVVELDSPEAAEIAGDVLAG